MSTMKLQLHRDAWMGESSPPSPASRGNTDSAFCASSFKPTSPFRKQKRRANMNLVSLHTAQRTIDHQGTYKMPSADGNRDLPNRQLTSCSPYILLSLGNDNASVLTCTLRPAIHLYQCVQPLSYVTLTVVSTCRHSRHTIEALSNSASFKSHACRSASSAIGAMQQ